MGWGIERAGRPVRFSGARATAAGGAGRRQPYDREADAGLYIFWMAPPGRPRFSFPAPPTGRSCPVPDPARTLKVPGSVRSAATGSGSFVRRQGPMRDRLRAAAGLRSGERDSLNKRRETPESTPENAVSPGYGPPSGGGEETPAKPAAPVQPPAPADAAPNGAPNGEGWVPPLTFNLLDNASPQAPIIDPGLLSRRNVAADPKLDLEERLEAYEDIIESEVGDTTLSRARNLERQLGIRQLYLKFEGGNPTGSQKDRIAAAQVTDALRRGFDAIILATCGNYGAAVAFAAYLAGLRCIIYIPVGYRTKRIQEMEAHGAEIVRMGVDYERAVEISRERAVKEEIYDANPGGPNTPIQLRAYGEISYEIYDELRDAPAVLAVSTSNGTTLAGIYRGFQSLYRRGKTSRVPRIVAGSSFNKNPIIRSWRKNLPACEDLDPNAVRETSVNEPLINWHSIDGDLALDAVRESGGWAGSGSDKAMLSVARMIREREGLNVLPASTVGLIALLERHAKEPLTGDRYVAVLTGRKS